MDIIGYTLENHEGQVILMKAPTPVCWFLNLFLIFNVGMNFDEKFKKNKKILLTDTMYLHFTFKKF